MSLFLRSNGTIAAKRSSASIALVRLAAESQEAIQSKMGFCAPTFKVKSKCVGSVFPLSANKPTHYHFLFCLKKSKKPRKKADIFFLIVRRLVPAESRLRQSNPQSWAEDDFSKKKFRRMRQREPQVMESRETLIRVECGIVGIDGLDTRPVDCAVE